MQKKRLFGDHYPALERFTRINGYLASTQEGSLTPRRDEWLQPIPSIGPLAYIWDWLCEIGLGETVSWVDIKAWSDITGIQPTREESKIIRQLSITWQNERARGSRKDELAPESYYKWLASQN